MHVRVYNRIADLPEDEWAAAGAPDFFFRTEFLSALAVSGVEQARYRYVVVTDAVGPAAIAVLSAFTLRLDLLSGDPWVARLRSWFPKLLDVPFVCCGLPASFGQHPMHVAARADAAAAFGLVDGCLNEWAAEERCGLTVWKELDAEAGLTGAARSRGYLPVPTLPDHVIDPLPRSAGEFVRAMRSAYRRKFRSALRLMEGTGPRWLAGPLRLELADLDPERARTFYSGYRKVIDRTPVRLETYPPAFFECLGSSGLDVRTLRLTHQPSGDTLTALLVVAQEIMTFALISKEKPRHAEGLYTTLLRCIVLYAIQCGCRAVRLGQTSDYAKRSLGASPRRLEAFLRMRSPIKDRALRLLGPALFPESRARALHVFRSAAGDGAGLPSPGGI
jgi:hypothetical protein